MKPRTPYEVGCPCCGRRAGEVCKNPRGGMRFPPHAARIRQANNRKQDEAV